ncbi:MAG TPA: hypothetical protein VFS05_16945 [Gemmatimonadaceae bacterium]|nr:hypothetical protein [Gemmatimonadaceae bacterium]
MSWRAVVSALDDGASFRSRVMLYMHPLAGRPVLWHVLGTLAELAPALDGVVVVHREGAAPALPESLPLEVVLRAAPAGEEELTLRAALADAERALLVDGAAPLVTRGQHELLLDAGRRGRAALVSSDSAPEAVALAAGGEELARCDALWNADGAGVIRVEGSAEALRIHDRHALGVASTALRERLVRQHQERGVTFMLPASVWLDCDVMIGGDTVIYPGVVLEGRTEIGSECVIGPYCRIIEAVIGRGAELKGWNYVARTSIRNHAVLEPHVRRGFE